MIRQPAPAAPRALRAIRDETIQRPATVTPQLRARDPLAHVGHRLDPDARRGRGATINPVGRFEPRDRAPADDGWDLPEELPSAVTEITIEKPRTIITRNNSPDISFDRSLNPYRGCEHGCVYCFARPSHAYLGLSPGLDFETKLTAKPDAAALLARELSAAGYSPRTLAIGTNTDAYQPIEKNMRIMRSVLEVLERFSHPVGIVTKSALIQRDIDILARMAARGLAKVAISVTTLDPKLARQMEPRAASPRKRLETIEKLTAAGIPVTVLVAPVIPAINEHEIERILDAAFSAGAREAGYVLLRLPLEVKDIMQDWLMTHHPDKLRHVMSLVRQGRGGKDYDSTWGQRQTGTGPLAWLIGRRFEQAVTRIGYRSTRTRLRTDLFSPPVKEQAQLSLF
jgi:DNA repair photolyase